MAPLLDSGGLTSLGPRELEVVLKGRLHQAVILAQLEHVPERWSKVKAYAEEVLQFDFGNCHARWLRGLALENGSGGSARREEAEQEMRRAVGCARSLGKGAEADQWEAEICRLFGDTSAAPAATAERAVPGPEQAPAASDGGPLARPAPAVQKGFFSKRGQRPEPPQPAAPAPAPAATAPAPAGRPARPERVSNKPDSGAAPSDVSAGAGVAPSTQRSRELQEEAQAQWGREFQEEAQALLREQRRQLEEQRAQLEELRRLLRLEQEGLQEQRLHEQRWQRAASEGLEVAGGFAEALSSQAAQAGGGARERCAQGEAAAMRRRGRDAALDARECQQACRAWCESQQQRHAELSTEVLSLKNMAAQELRERQDASRQHVAELREMAKRMGELKASTKSLRDNVRLRTAGAPRDDKEEADLQEVAGTIADFRALPLGAKVATLLDDAAFLWVMGLSVALGMLLALGISIEGFSSMHCRFSCTR